MEYVTQVVTQLNNVHNNNSNNNSTTTKVATFRASAANALDVYYKFRIIYLCNEKEESQVCCLNSTLLRVRTSLCELHISPQYKITYLLQYP